MILESVVGKSLLIIVAAFFAEYIDSALGMMYGTAMTPFLLLLGFQPLQIVPAVLVSEVCTGLLAGLLHHRVGNVNFKPKEIKPRVILPKLRELGLVEGFKRGIPLDLKVAILLAMCSIIGAVVGVLVATSIPSSIVKLYIGVLVLLIGIAILLTLKRSFGFSWAKVTGLGLLSSFNKAISGGGYGPVVTGGQLLAGVDSKRSIGITSLAEALTCIVGIIVYILAKGISVVDIRGLVPLLVLGAVAAVPFSVLTVKSVNTLKLKVVIGILIVLLGIFTLAKVVSP